MLAEGPRGRERKKVKKRRRKAKKQKQQKRDQGERRGGGGGGGREIIDRFFEALLSSPESPKSEQNKEDPAATGRHWLGSIAHRPGRVVFSSSPPRWRRLVPRGNNSTLDVPASSLQALASPA